MSDSNELLLFSLLQILHFEVTSKVIAPTIGSMTNFTLWILFLVLRALLTGKLLETSFSRVPLV